LELVLRAFRDIPKEKRLYFKIIEPHKTGDPHLHAMLFIPKENVDLLRLKFEFLMMKNDIEQYDFQTDIINPVNYMIKYVLKSIDDYRFENTKLFQYSPLALWYVRWGIRRFSMSRHFVRIDLYRKLKGRYDLDELTVLYKLGKIDYYIEPVTRNITDIFYNDDILGALPIYQKDVIPPKIQYSHEKPCLKSDKKYTPVYDENKNIIGYTNGKHYLDVSDIKPLNKMTPFELWKYEQDLFNEFDNPFLENDDLDILFDKLYILEKYFDENLEERPSFWLREEDLNLRPSGYEEFVNCELNNFSHNDDIF